MWIALVLAAPAAAPPLRLVADVALPGPAARFDYQSLDAAAGRLYIAHMNADRLLVFDTSERKVVASLDGFPRVRGVCVVPERKRVYAAARGSHEVVVVDTGTLAVVARVPVQDPDGIAYAPKVDRVFVSDQGSRADAVIDARTNRLVTSVPLGGEAGNTVYDSGSDRILVAVDEPAQLAVLDPATARVSERIPLPGVRGAHGVALDVAHRLAFVAGEGNHALAVVDLDTRAVLETHPVPQGPDVLSFDAGAGLLYIAAESGNVSVFARRGRGLASRGEIAIPHAHTVCADPETHQVYLPLEAVGGRPLLRIMEPVASPRLIP